MLAAGVERLTTALSLFGLRHWRRLNYGAANHYRSSLRRLVLAVCGSALAVRLPVERVDDCGHLVSLVNAPVQNNCDSRFSAHASAAINTQTGYAIRISGPCKVLAVVVVGVVESRING